MDINKPKPGIAIKGFVINDDDELLIIRREPNDTHKPGIWEVPGGRMNQGENPFSGLLREVKEEAGLDVELKEPLGVHHFTRDDGQVITMICFLCRPLNYKVKLSHEHTDFQWLKLSEAKKIIAPEFVKEIEVYERYFKK